MSVWHKIDFAILYETIFNFVSKLRNSFAFRRLCFEKYAIIVRIWGQFPAETSPRLKVVVIRAQEERTYFVLH